MRKLVLSQLIHKAGCIVAARHIAENHLLLAIRRVHAINVLLHVFHLELLSTMRTRSEPLIAMNQYFVRLELTFTGELFDWVASQTLHHALKTVGVLHQDMFTHRRLKMKFSFTNIALVGQRVIGVSSHMIGQRYTAPTFFATSLAAKGQIFVVDEIFMRNQVLPVAKLFVANVTHRITFHRSFAEPFMGPQLLDPFGIKASKSTLGTMGWSLFHASDHMLSNTDLITAQLFTIKALEKVIRTGSWRFTFLLNFVS